MVSYMTEHCPDQQKSIATVIKHRRSVRSFSSEPVSNAVVRDILETALWAPSANNRQPWSFYILSSEHHRNLINELVSDKLHKASKSSELAAEVLEEYRKNFTVFKEAPVVIVCCFKKPNRFNNDLFSLNIENQHMSGELISLSMAVQNILLVATEKNLGSLVMTAPLIAAEEIKNNLTISPRMAIGAIVCLGSALSIPKPEPRKELSQVAYFLQEE